MGIPEIQSYSLPDEQEIPAPVVPWKIDPKRAALLVHDMQKYFVGAFPASMSPIAPAIANIVKLRNASRAANVPVFFTAQPGGQLPADRGLQADFWGSGMNDTAAHRGVIDPLSPDEKDILLVKWRYSAFQRTNLEHMLRARGRDQLIVTGVFAHIGCLLTAADAFMHDVQPFLVADAIAAYSKDLHTAALTYAAGCFAVPITTKAIVDAMSGASPLTLERMRSDIAKALLEEPGAIGDDDNLMDLGLDSMRAMDVVRRWNDAGANVEFSRFAVNPTLRNWWQLVSSKEES